jgi:hexosaminidase
MSQHARIFPQPQSYVVSNESFEFNEKLFVELTPELEPILTVIKYQFMDQHAVELDVAALIQPDIKVEKITDSRQAYYRLAITKSGAKIEYSDSQGLFYALQSLLQQTVSSNIIMGATIEDWPNLGYRGVHLDCARHFFTIPELENFIDEIARLKFNKFHWHLTDDQGWRLEIKKYPKLTSVGAWRDSTLIGHFSKTPVEYDHVRYGGFYTQEQAKTLVQYAKLRGVEIIPEIEMPGHAGAALAAYPELGCTGIQQGVVGTWGVFDDVFCSKDETISFLKNVLDEVIAIFPSKTIHVGGDESPKVRWEVCPACQKQMKDHSLHNEHELQSYVIGEMSKYLSSKGRILMGWDEILEGGLAENAQVMSWRGTEGGIAAAKAGHYVVMTPTSYCYFDYYQSGSPGEPLAIGGYLPLEKVYAFQPVPKELNENERKFILGGQANLWTEYLPDMDAVYYSAFPRLVAMSEVLWTEEKNRKTYNEFVVGLNKSVFPYFEKHNINYSRAAFEPKVNWEYSDKGFQLTISSPFKEADMRFRNPVQLGFEHGYHTTPVLDLERTDRVVPVNYNAEVLINGSLAGQTPVKLQTHLAIGCNMDFETSPSEKYNVHGDLGLVDGVVGGKPWKGDQWLGFETDTIKFQLDFGYEQKLKKISLGTLNDPGSWIYRPKKVAIEYSLDGEKWKKRNMILTGDSFISSKRMKTRFIRFTVTNDEKIVSGLPGAGFTPWTFLDELIITK